MLLGFPIFLVLIFSSENKNLTTCVRRVWLKPASYVTEPSSWTTPPLHSKYKQGTDAVRCKCEGQKSGDVSENVNGRMDEVREEIDYTDASNIINISVLRN